jgi:integrase
MKTKAEAEAALRANFTQKTVTVFLAALKAEPDTKRRSIPNPDRKYNGHCLRTNGDTASFNTLDRWVRGGNPAFFRYEDAHAMTLAESLEAHLDAKEKKREGTDPREERRQQKAVLALGPHTELIVHWMGPGGRDKTATGKEAYQTLNNVLAAHLDKPIDIFEGEEGLKLGRQILSNIAFTPGKRKDKQGRGPMALLVKRLLGRLLNHAIEIGKLKVNPIPKIKLKGVEVAKRDHFLDAAEITLHLRAGAAMGMIGSGLVTWLWDTACRRGEVSALRWADVDPIGRTATFRDTKNGTDFVVHVTDRMAAALPPKTDSEYVFAGAWSGRPYNRWSSLKERMDAEIARLNDGQPIRPWRWHDLRRTAATFWEDEFEVDHALVVRALNHTPQDVTGKHYGKGPMHGPRRNLLERWSTYLQALLTPPKRGVVVPLRP